MFDVHLLDTVPWVCGELGYVGQLIGWAVIANHWVAFQPPLRNCDMHTQRVPCDRSFAIIRAFWSNFDFCLTPQNVIFMTFAMKIHP